MNNINSELRTIVTHLEISNQQEKYKERIKNIENIRKELNKKLQNIDRGKAVLRFVPLGTNLRTIIKLYNNSSDEDNDSSDEDI